MNQSRWERLSAIYDAARRQPPEARPAFLDGACSGDTALRAEIESLLRHDLPTVPAFIVTGAVAESPPAVASGTHIGIYRIERPLGAGGMGEVHLATDTRLNRPVALKFVAAAADQDARKRFQQETRAVSSLNHPHILTIHDSGQFAGRDYLVTEFVDGGTLKTWRDAAPRTWRQTIELLIGVADALATAHDAGILHRDVKPANILVTQNGYAKLADFGLAKLATTHEHDTRSEPRTGTGVVVGTIDYMSPEQLSGGAVDRRSDIFSFGIVLYEMLAGRRPFTGETSLHVVERILRQAPPPLDGNLPAPLRDVVAKLLEKEPGDRYQSMREVVVDLRRLVRQTTEVRAATIAPTGGGRWLRAAAAVVAAVVVAGATGWWWWNSNGRVINSIAVLPVATSGIDAETEYGVIANIIDRLSQISDLKVMAHSAVVPYKTRGADAQTIGRELAVEAMLTVRLVRRDENLTINLELVDTGDNSHLWGEQYERKFADLLDLQQELPVAISDVLRVRMSGDAKQRLTRKHTENPEAYQAYVKGRYAWELWSQEGSKQAVAYFEEAIAKDPDYAPAYSGLADAYIFGSGVGLPRAEALRRGKAAVAKALQLDPTLGEAHAARAQTLVADRDFARAEAEFKEAIRLSPSYAASHHQYSHLLLLLGRTDDSLVESRKYLELDPSSASPIGHLGYHYLYARRYDDAIRELRKYNELFPNDAGNHRILGDAYVQKGMFTEAMNAYVKALEVIGAQPGTITALRNAFARAGMEGYLRERLNQYLAAQQAWDENAVTIAAFYARLGEKDQSFEWLERAYAVNAEGLVRLKEDLAFDSLRSDIRFKGLLQRVGLPQ
jgi:serine/threonine-protein kinase